MKFLVLLLAAALAAGCSATTRINVAAGTGGAVPSAGTSTSGGSFGLNVQGGSGAAAIVAAGAIAALVYGREDLRERYLVEPWLPSPAPELLEGRAINIQDCTKPIKDPGANLRCR
jgi:hypothetical protein